MEIPCQPKAATDIYNQIDDSLARILPFQLFSQHVSDAVVYEIGELLNQHPNNRVRAWNRNPRLYTLLRLLDCDHESETFKRFSNEEINDLWLPLPHPLIEQLLPQTFDLSAIDFERAQSRVLSTTERLHEDKSLSALSEHQSLRDGSVFFEDLDILGKGGTAEVLKVRHKPSGQYFACKRIHRSGTTKIEKNRLRVFKQEVDILQRISHHHLVIFVASFTDVHSFSLILNPVAKDVLKFVLERQTREKPLSGDSIQILRRAFLCLATAIAYLHRQKVRHKDIKPGNVLLCDGSVRLCDFGISRDWSKAGQSTTEGHVFDFTRRYCAPEVFEHDPRNTSSDIWSLGCVFLEIVTVIRGYPLDEMNDFLREHSDGASDRQGLCYAHDAMLAWMVKIRDGDSADDLPLDWSTPMLRMVSSKRIKAEHVRTMIFQQASKIPRPNLFLSRCCTRTDSMSPIDTFEHLPPSETPKVSNRFITETSTARSRPTSELQSPVRSGSAPSPTINDSPYTSQESGTVSIHSSSKFATISHDSSLRSQDYSPVMQVEAIPPSLGSRTSPEPPSASFEPNCHCARELSERHIFKGTCQSLNLDSLPLTAETCSNCELGRNQVQIYETPCQDPKATISSMPMLWWVTRRLVISYLSGSPELRHCTSFWLPLADMHFTVDGCEVILHFSDCNQIKARPSGSWGHYFDWVYDGRKPNNTVKLRFDNHQQALRFVDCARLPNEDGTTVKSRRHIPLFDSLGKSQEAHVFDVGRLAIRNYRAVTVTETVGTLSSSKTFIQWPEVDINIQLTHHRRAPFVSTSRYTISLDIHNVSMPTYHSGVRGEPAQNYDKIGRFKRALQVKCTASLAFPIGSRHTLPTPPSVLVDLLHALTGWKLRYFGQVQTFKSKIKHNINRTHGRADLMLWEKDARDSFEHRSAARITLRQRESADCLWTSGIITPMTQTTASSHLDATITVASKCSGSLLDVTSMTAIASERFYSQEAGTHGSSPQGTKKCESDAEHTKCELSFEDRSFCDRFLTLIESLKRMKDP